LKADGIFTVLYSNNDHSRHIIYMSYIYKLGRPYVHPEKKEGFRNKRRLQIKFPKWLKWTLIGLGVLLIIILLPFIILLTKILEYNQSRRKTKIK
jgi:hypothetical protein